MSRERPEPDARFHDVRRIAVLRGGGLGDLIFALPAVDALAAAYPDAEIVLLGTRLHRELLEGRPGPVSRVEVLPSEPGADTGGDATASFVARLRTERFDLACQLHGGGRHSNPLVRGLAARHTVGAHTEDAAPLERSLPYLYYQHEVLRWLEVVALAGAPFAAREPRLALTPDEAADADRRRHAADGLVVIHPGATDPRRRWPAARFAEIARRCADAGRQVVVVGDAGDAALADEVATAAAGGRGADGRVASAAGRLTLSELVALCAAADLFVGNDSGPRHLAQAVGCATAGIFWVGNAVNGAPLTRARHRMQLSWTTRCPVCGIDATQVGWTAPRCAHDPSFVADVAVDAVWGDVRALLGITATTAPPRDT